MYVIASLYPRTYTIYPASLLVGVGSALLWVAQGQYITDISVGHAASLGQPRQASMGRFNGIFFTGFELTQLVGNLVTSVVSENSRQVLPRKTTTQHRPWATHFPGPHPLGPSIHAAVCCCGRSSR